MLTLLHFAPVVHVNVTLPDALAAALLGLIERATDAFKIGGAFGPRAR